MRCQECGKTLTNENDCYGHDCEVEVLAQKINQERRNRLEKNYMNSGKYNCA